MMAEFNNHSLIDLEKLFLDDPSEILRLNTRSFAAQLNHISQSLTDFFSLNPRVKSAYLSSDAFGYTRVSHKEGIKVLTDQHGDIDSHYGLPNNINASLQNLSQLISYLTDRLKLIILKLTSSNDQASKEVHLSDRTMLDIVHYFNRRTGLARTPEVGYDTNEVNCVPHYDPGLFSLSILSTCEGLQLKDQRTNTWTDGPVNSEIDKSDIGVLWLGEAARILTGNRFKAGIHRVVYPHVAHQARLTIWQEVCTKNQIEQLFESDDDTQRLSADAHATLVNQPYSKRMQVLPGGETRKQFMQRVESDRGLSMSKSGRRDLRVHREVTPPTMTNAEPSVNNRDTTLPPNNMNHNRLAPRTNANVDLSSYTRNTNFSPKNTNSNNYH